MLLGSSREWLIDLSTMLFDRCGHPPDRLGSVVSRATRSATAGDSPAIEQEAFGPIRPRVGDADADRRRGARSLRIRHKAQGPRIVAPRL